MDADTPPIVPEDAPSTAQRSTGSWPTFRRRPTPRWVFVALFALTALTTTFAGSYFWEATEGEVTRPSDYLRPDLLGGGLAYAFWLLLILGAHEMGHYFACRRHGIPATLPFFLPGIPPIGTFGAVIRIRGVVANRRALFDVAAAGPLAGFAVAFPVLVVGILTARPGPPFEPQPGSLGIGSPMFAMAIQALAFGDASLDVGSLYGAGWVGMLITSMNLFPVGQLDGGHIAYAISRRLHRALAWTVIVGLASLVLAHMVAFRSMSVYTLWWVVLVVLRDRHPRLEDETIPLDPRRRWLAFLLLIVFVLSFIPVPLLFF